MFDPNQQSSSFVYYFELSNPIFIFFDAQSQYKKRNMIKYFFFAYLPFVQRTPKLFMATTSRALEEYNGKAIHFLSAQYTYITYINLFLTILHARMGKPLLNTKTNVDLEYFTIENTMDPAK